MDQNDCKIIGAMRIYGGSFVKKLSELYMIADFNNQKKLKIAFPEYFKQYEKMSQGKDIIV